MCVCMSVCTSVCVCFCFRVSVLVWVSVLECVYVQASVCMCVCLCVYRTIFVAYTHCKANTALRFTPQPSARVGNLLNIFWCFKITSRALPQSMWALFGMTIDRLRRCRTDHLKHRTHTHTAHTTPHTHTHTHRTHHTTHTHTHTPHARTHTHTPRTRTHHTHARTHTHTPHARARTHTHTGVVLCTRKKFYIQQIRCWFCLFVTMEMLGKRQLPDNIITIRTTQSAS